MAFQVNGNRAAHAAPMAEINTTPMVDVMLVLLVIFLITAPLLNQAVPIDLPKVDASKSVEAPNSMQVAIDAKGLLTIDGAAVDIGQLPDRLRSAAGTQSVPEMHLRADRRTPYERVTEVMAAAQSAGITKIAFVTDKPNGAPKAVN